MFCESFMALSAYLLAFLKFCSSVTVRPVLHMSDRAQMERNKLVSQELLPCSVLIQFSSSGLYIAFGSSHGADFPANEDVLHPGRAAWNENHIYFTAVVTGCLSLVYTGLAFWRKGRRAYLGAFSANGIRSYICIKLLPPSPCLSKKSSTPFINETVSFCDPASLIWKRNKQNCTKI